MIEVSQHGRLKYGNRRIKIPPMLVTLSFLKKRHTLCISFILFNYGVLSLLHSIHDELARPGCDKVSFKLITCVHLSVGIPRMDIITVYYVIIHTILHHFDRCLSPDLLKNSLKENWKTLKMLIFVINLAPFCMKMTNCWSKEDQF